MDAVGDDYAVGRSHADAPEIDGLVYVLDGQGLSAGDMVEVEISAADEYDLSGYLAVGE